jgi:serine/threonine protein phosphatase PrpC
VVAFAAGRVDVVLFARAEGRSREAASVRAAESLGELASLLGGMLPDYAFEALADPGSFALLWRPFDFTGASVGEIRRREEQLHLEFSMPRPAFGRGRRPGPHIDSPDTLYVVHPFLPRASSLTRLLRAMLLHHQPLLLQVTATPTRLLAHEEQAFIDAIGRCESTEQSAAVLARSVAPAVRVQQRRAAAVARVLLDQFVRLQHAPFLLTVTLASPVTIPPGLLEATGVEITAPVGLAASGPQAASDALQMGGYDVVVAKDARDLDDARRALSSLEWFPWGTTLAPTDLRRMRALVDAREAAAAFRLPLAGIGGLPGIDVRAARTLPLPREVAGLAAGPCTPDQLVLGANRYLGVPLEARLLEVDRRQHCYLIGQTGVGKTTLLKTMALGDIAAGRGVALIDPHGDLFEEVIGSIPASRRDDVVVFEPTDVDFPVGLNLLECASDEDRYFVVREMRSVMERLLGDFYQGKAAEYAGPVFYQHMQMNMLLAMSDPACPGTLLEFYEIFQHKEFWHRWRPLGWRDPLLVRWARNNLPGIDYTKRTSDSATYGEYLSSKFDDFVFDPRLRLIFGQRRSTIDIDEIMSQGKILLVNLAKGQLSEANARFLGMVLMAKIQAAAMARIRIPAAERRPFYVYVDEFQSLATDSFVLLLSEARKFGLGLVLANQFASQIEDRRIREAIFGNVGTVISFRVGHADAELLEPLFVPYFDRLDLANLPNWQACARTTVRGQVVPAFTLETVRPATAADGAVALDVRQRSRIRYGRPRAAVEEEIAVSLGSGPRRDVLAGSVIASATHREASTAKGDAHAHMSISTVDAALALLVVCDGVLSSPKGAQAADKACSVLTSRFEQTAAQSEKTETVLAAAVRATDMDVYKAFDGNGHCRLVVAVVQPDTLTISLASFGGGRAFVFEGGTLRRVTPVEAESAASQSEGTDTGVGGPGVGRPIAQAIGQRGELHVDVTTVRLEKAGSLLCLASRGVSEASLMQFIEDLPSPLDDEAAARWCRAVVEESGDEATLIVMRVGEPAVVRFWRAKVEQPSVAAKSSWTAVG